MIEQEYTISGLYYRYNRRNIDDIKKILKSIKIVMQEHVVKGHGSVFNYCSLSKESMKKIYDSPRNVAINFQEVDNDKITNLKEYKTITYLVKSSSRFILKTDICEILDQIEDCDLFDDKLKAICYKSIYESLPDTDGEHFIMKATLLTDK